MKGVLFYLAFIVSISSFSQNFSITKEIFTYKTVDGHEIEATIFLPASKGPHAVVVYLHGGGFIFGNRDQGLNSIIKEKLLEKGFAVVSADYRLAPETKLAGIIQDVNDVVSWLRKNGPSTYGVDENKICVVGGSSGGYLALSTGFDKKSAPNLIVAISTPTGFSNANIEMGDLSILDRPGPYDIVEDGPVSYGDYSRRMDLWRFLGRNRLALYEIFGFDPSQQPDKLNEFKLNTNIDADYPPTLLIHAKYDHLVPLNEVEEFQEYLNKTSVKNELLILDNGHSNELINQNPEAIDHMITFIQENLK